MGNDSAHRMKLVGRPAGKEGGSGRVIGRGVVKVAVKGVVGGWEACEDELARIVQERDRGGFSECSLQPAFLQGGLRSRVPRNTLSRWSAANSRNTLSRWSATNCP